ncbi:MAG: hypothetical protein DMF46_03535 [Verrucomicrobia bacterium]|nr:MAG: hypothetical protein DMF46_03535 [Verrucomicrobiota bacterium]
MRLGRPKIAVGARKTKITGVRLAKAERKMLEKAARRRQSKLSFWMRDVLLSSAKKEIALSD